MNANTSGVPAATITAIRNARYQAQYGRKAVTQ